MDIKQIPAMVEKIADENMLPLPTVELSYRMTTKWGSCNQHKRQIKLNARFCELNSIEVVHDLILHELAHLLEPDHKSGFENLCNEMGIPLHIYMNHPEYKAVEGKYKYQCFDCGHISTSQKRWKRKRLCGKCSPHGYNEKFVLVELTN